MGISREVFLRQCKRRFGNGNPERVRMEHWEWMVRRGGGPYSVRKDLGLPSNYAECGPDGCAAPGGPDWCFDRFGASRTTMPDGRIICVGGEHEDYYDPDFCVYNDVIVLRPAAGQAGVSFDSGEVEIYGYPESVFAPTDFHATALVGTELFVIGRLGYQPKRVTGMTPVFVLDTDTYEFREVWPHGPAPGWVYKHYASYDASSHSVAVRGGKLWTSGTQKDPLHLGAHRLHLDTMRWELIAASERRRRFVLTCESEYDGSYVEPSPSAFESANVPCVFVMTDDGGADDKHVFDVAGVRVSFESDFLQVRVLIDGHLEPEMVEQIVLDVLHNLERETDARWSAEEVPSFANE